MQAAENGASRVHLANESGEGDITIYPAFSGIELVYNDMHMAWCNKNQAPVPGVLELNYCREGRCECRFGANQFCYLAAGDLSLCSLQGPAHESEFPTAHYHGITVTVDFTRFSDEMRRVFALLGIDPARIQALANARDFTILRGNETVQHIFSELYTVPDALRGGYIRLKLLELLLVLTGLDIDTPQSNICAFSEAQIEVIKRVHAFLLAHYREHFTIAELAARFDVSPTALKTCFREVYGAPPYAYLKQYRLQLAERMLKETRLTVAEIAAQIGFLNPNKFTSAFRDAYGLPPTDYRRRASGLVQTDRK